ncbi:MAG: hypothetical protein HN347_16125 [Bacteroidetes bacterium]|nr:hypothetical protein [Bacteroidota bacterium]
MKEKLLKAWLWALRNPLHNYYYRNYTEGKETNLKGTARVKSGKNVSSWRTFTCMDTGDNNGNIIDFDNSLFGYQSATFDRNGKSQYRKSYCKPFNYWVFIIIFRWRFGYEKGLFQSQFNFPIMWMNKDNRTNYIEWKQLKYKNIER